MDKAEARKAKFSVPSLIAIVAALLSFTTGAFCVAVAAQTWHLFPYTTLSRKQVLNADAAGPELKILISNVLQQNRDSELPSKPPYLPSSGNTLSIFRN
jgi:hypothetical protein